MTVGKVDGKTIPLCVWMGGEGDLLREKRFRLPHVGRGGGRRRRGGRRRVRTKASPRAARRAMLPEELSQPLPIVPAACDEELIPLAGLALPPGCAADSGRTEFGKANGFPCTRCYASCWRRDTPWNSGGDTAKEILEPHNHGHLSILPPTATCAIFWRARLGRRGDGQGQSGFPEQAGGSLSRGLRRSARRLS